MTIGIIIIIIVVVVVVVVVRRYCTDELVLSIIIGFRYWYQLLSIIITASCLYSVNDTYRSGAIWPCSGALDAAAR